MSRSDSTFEEIVQMNKSVNRFEPLESEICIRPALLTHPPPARGPDQTSRSLIKFDFHADAVRFNPEKEQSDS